jgi:hypothetical protein
VNLSIKLQQTTNMVQILHKKFYLSKPQKENKENKKKLPNHPRPKKPKVFHPPVHSTQKELNRKTFRGSAQHIDIMNNHNRNKKKAKDKRSKKNQELNQSNIAHGKL